MPSSTSSSKVPGTGKGGLAPTLTFFDPEHVDRPVPDRPWRAILLAVLIAVVALTAGWEVYWRGKGYIAGDFKNTSGLWAQERRKATGDATVIIGSSRVLFDIDLDIWAELSGVRPVQLALEGTSPRVFLKDLAEDEDFHGTVIVGVTTVVFFTGEGGLREEVIKYAKEQSLSQRVGHELSKPVERAFAFFETQTRPRRQVSLWPLPLRDGMKPRFDPRKLETMDATRNTQMWNRLLDDPAYLEEAQGQWLLAFELLAPPPGPDGGPPPPMPDEAINAVIGEVKANVDKIRARGGEVAFVQAPVDGPFAEVEQAGFPRERFWDRLLAATGSAGVTFYDHAELQGFHLPEWSHLAPAESKRYTRALVPIFYDALEKKRAGRELSGI